MERSHKQFGLLSRNSDYGLRLAAGEERVRVYWSKPNDPYVYLDFDKEEFLNVMKAFIDEQEIDND